MSASLVQKYAMLHSVSAKILVPEAKGCVMAHTQSGLLGFSQAADALTQMPLHVIIAVQHKAMCIHPVGYAVAG